MYTFFPVLYNATNKKPIHVITPKSKEILLQNHPTKGKIRLDHDQVIQCSMLKGKPVINNY